MKVPCSYWNCGSRRAHYESPHVMRKHRIVDVPDDIGFDFMTHRAYCSVECQAYDGTPVTTNGEKLLMERLRFVDPRNGE